MVKKVVLTLLKCAFMMKNKSSKKLVWSNCTLRITRSHDQYSHTGSHTRQQHTITPDIHTHDNFLYDDDALHIYNHYTQCRVWDIKCHNSVTRFLEVQRKDWLCTKRFGSWEFWGLPDGSKMGPMITDTNYTDLTLSFSLSPYEPRSTSGPRKLHIGNLWAMEVGHYFHGESVFFKIILHYKNTLLLLLRTKNLTTYIVLENSHHLVKI